MRPLCRAGPPLRRAGPPLADLAGLTQEMYERCAPGEPEDGFGDRWFRLGITFRGAGRPEGDLDPGCAAALAAVLEALGKRAGSPPATRTARSPAATSPPAPAASTTSPRDHAAGLYALVHMPLEAQPWLLRRAAGWLRPGGWLLTVTGQRAWTGTEDNWLGGPATMWWSHADADTYRAWLTEAGLRVTAQEFVPEGAGGHALFWARRPPQAARRPSQAVE